MYVCIYMYVHRRNSRGGQGDGPPPNLEGWDIVACIPPKLLAPRRNVEPPIINAELRHCICTYIQIHIDTYTYIHTYIHT